MNVKNKKIIVTGGASGIGKELTKQLILKGAFVSVADIDGDNLRKLEEEINSDKLKTFIVDMGNRESINNFKNQYMDTIGEIDILINNAGIIQPFMNVDDLTDDIISKVMKVNFFGPVMLTRLFIKELISRKEGYIVNVSSMGGFFPFPRQSIYGASKAALKIFTEGLYAELIDTNVKVMVVFPGAIATNITKNSNLKVDTTKAKYKMLSAEKAAKLIIKGIKKNKFKLFVGSDSKLMRFFYKFNSKLAIKTVNKKMRNI